MKPYRSYETEDFIEVSFLAPTMGSVNTILPTHTQRPQVVPEEVLWLAGQRSPNTCRAYQVAVRDFLDTMNITPREQLRQVGAINAGRTAVPSWM